MTITLEDGSIVRLCNRCEGTIERFGSTVVIVPDPDSRAKFEKLRNPPPSDLCPDCAAEFWCWLQNEPVSNHPIFSDN